MICTFANFGRDDPTTYSGIAGIRSGYTPATILISEEGPRLELVVALVAMLLLPPVVGA